ncbi:sugar ABC transporter substrate-binding protein [Salibacterium salarium]|uniref:Sugar ABC transporter substrate-binding protein n=1 Tax=Salibacterium salarium TaxID=284579 RepID=A0A428N5T9_9BACI|nr:sugar-binding protein [Salibacterium salarium]RSL33612.1 sugar ABC transporter substrate-binding protein [Salibacterium salarium]
MEQKKKAVLYTGGGLLFGVCFLFMLYFGKETFYVEGTEPTAQTYDYHFALITEETGNAYWQMIEQSAKATAADHNIYLESMGPRKANPEEVLRTMDQMIAANVDGIITQGLPGPRFLDLVVKANEHGIPVVTVDSDMPESERTAYIGTDNYESGYLAGEELIRETKGKQSVGIITGNVESLNQQQRIKGFEEAIKNVERIEVVDIKQSNITEVGAAQATYSMIKQHSNINALFGTSALDGIGMVQGVEEMTVWERPYMIAFDTLPETINLLEQEKLDATIAQYPEEMGKQAIQTMRDLQSQANVEPLQHTGTDVIRSVKQWEDHSS